MYGSSGKMGRGGGGAAAKRGIHAPSINRRTAPTGRMSMGGGGRGPGGASSAATSSPSTSSLQLEESFSLIRENPLSFGMAIKLVPDLVEEIKRVEAQGGTARIKFDANSSNPNGNVIDVGDKTFKFTWSKEPGDFCDIYEERRSGEDGNGLLVESGATWRKLNVERELDESTKNHVKRRSEEAERKLKSRKVQVLDPNNPSMKKHMRELVSVESNNTWRNFKHRKEPPFKKPKSEPPSASAPPKSVFRSGLSTPLSKGKLSSSSPLSSQPEQVGHTSVADTLAQTTNKTPSSDKEKQSRLIGSATRDKFKHNQNMEANPADLKRLMISLLSENQHNGMNLKALEKAVNDHMPNSVRQIDPILKQIATFQAPGKYFLKPGVEMESVKKHPPQSTTQNTSSPGINHQESLASQRFDQQSMDPSSMGAGAHDEVGELNSSPVHMMDNVEKIDILQNSPEQFSDKNVSDNSEGAAGSSSNSGSDSDSDSDSDSSNSSDKSRSSDSESHQSSSSKQASDEDVDIMTSDDEKEPQSKLLDSDPPALSSPVLLSHPDNEFVDIINDDKQDDHDSDVDVVDSPRNSPEDDRHSDRPANTHSFPNEEVEVPVKEIKLPLANNDERHERQDGNRKVSDASESAVNDGFKQGQYGMHEGFTKLKSKRQIENKHPDERTHSKKKLKSNNTSQPVSGTISSIFGESPCNSSPDRPPEGSDEGLIDQLVTEPIRDGADDLNLQTGVKQLIPARPVSDSQQPGQKSFETHGRSDSTPVEKRSGRRDSLDHVKYSERSLQTQKGFNAEAQGEDGLVKERRPMKVGSECVGDKLARTTKPLRQKPENLGMTKEAVAHSNSHMGYSNKENNSNTSHRSPVMNGRSGMLRREYSDLELGEFREPSHDETPGIMKQFEMKSSDKYLKNKRTDSEYWDSDFSKGKPSNMVTADSGKISPPDPDTVGSGIPDGPSKMKAPENYINDPTRPQQKGSSRLMNQFNQSQGDHVEVSSQNSKVPENNGRSRSVEAGTGQGGSLDGSGVAPRKASVKSAEQKHDTVRIGARVTKESKKQKTNVINGSNDRQKNTSFAKSTESSQKRKESSKDEICSPYTKYDKEDPELKGPIKDMTQYQEYVNDYQEKYGNYISLNNILESTREEFIKYGQDLEACKGRDMKRYHEIVEQIRSSYRQCGERHKRLKKIFIVLHEELTHLKQMIKDFAAAYRKD